MGLLDIIFPPTCAGCGRWGNYICWRCMLKVSIAYDQKCPACGKGSIRGLVHARCKSRNGLEGLTICLGYKGLVSRLVVKLKFRMVTHLVEDLCNLALSLGDLSAISNQFWIIVPVPLHTARFRTRGFNQSQLIAFQLSQFTGWPVCTKILRRHKHTSPQSLLLGKERGENVADAFSLTQAGARLDQVNILLVDDVWTTGATMRAAAKPLKLAGVKNVWGFVLAS